MLGFIIWLLVGCAFVGFGIYCFYSKKEVAFGFWANADMFSVNNVNAYNRAMGKLWCMLEAIITMAIYVTVIEKKYRKK